MRIKIVLCIVALVVLLSFGACSSREPSLSEAEAYRLFEEELMSLTEFQFRAEAEIELFIQLMEFEHGLVEMEASVSMAQKEMYLASQMNFDGDSLAMDLQTEVYVFADMTYMNMASTMQGMVDAVLSQQGLRHIPFSVLDQLGGYAFMQVPTEDLEDVFSIEAIREELNIPEAFSDEVAEQYLALEGDVFTFILEGQEVFAYMEGGFQNLFQTTSGSAINPLDDFSVFMDSMTEEFGEEALVDARLVMTRARGEEGFSLGTELYIPELFHVVQMIQVIPEPPAPLERPLRYLSGEEMFLRAAEVEEILWEILLERRPPDTFDWEAFEIFDPETDEIQLVYDLENLSLFGHNLAGSSVLETHRFPDGRDGFLDVIVFSSVELFEEEGFLTFFDDRLPMTMTYELVQGGNAADLVRDQALESIDLGSSSRYFMVSPLRVNADYSLAALTIEGRRESQFAIPIMSIRLAQTIPDSDDVLLLTIRPVGIRRPEDAGEVWEAVLEDLFAILDELEEHFGIELRESVAAFLEHPYFLPPPRE